jgi:hypothetical protein
MLRIKITIYKDEIRKNLPTILSTLTIFILIVVFFALAVHFKAQH